MKWLEKWKSWQELPAKKKISYLCILLLAAVVILLYISTWNPRSERNGIPQREQGEDLEEKLRSVLSKVDGAGEVDVIINYESGTELVPALSETVKTSTDRNGDVSSETTDRNSEVATIRESGDTAALIVKEIQPGVRGVLVVAQGAGDIRVRLQLLEAVQTFLNIDTDKVEVLKMYDTDR